MVRFLLNAIPVTPRQAAVPRLGKADDLSQVYEHVVISERLAAFGDEVRGEGARRLQTDFKDHRRDRDGAWGSR
jgi:hypothetical protein